MDQNQLAYLTQLDPQAYRELLMRQKLTGAKMGLGDRLAVGAERGLGRAQGMMFPVSQEVASQVDPRTLQAMRQQAMLQMGLGMLAARDKNQGLGAGMLYGLNQGQDVMGRGLGQAWAANRAKREDERFDWQKNAQTERWKREDEQRAQDRADTQAYRTQTQANWEAQFRASQEAARRAERAAERAATAAERQQAIFDYNRAMDETRVALGERIAEMRARGVQDSDPMLETLLTQYETYAGDKSLRPTGSGNPLLMGGADGLPDADALRSALSEDQPAMAPPPPAPSPTAAPPIDTSMRPGIAVAGDVVSNIGSATKRGLGNWWDTNVLGGGIERPDITDPATRQRLGLKPVILPPATPERPSFFRDMTLSLRSGQ